LSGWSVDLVCKKCGFNESECICNVKKEYIEPNKHRLYFKFERRNGKDVTIVGPFSIQDLEALSKRVKKRLGVGGTVDGDWLLFQGKIETKVKEALSEFRFR
jgi:translation initiation factor 1